LTGIRRYWAEASLSSRVKTPSPQKNSKNTKMAVMPLSLPLQPVRITHIHEDFFSRRGAESAEKHQEKRSAINFISAASATLRETVLSRPMPALLVPAAVVRKMSKNRRMSATPSNINTLCWECNHNFIPGGPGLAGLGPGMSFERGHRRIRATFFRRQLRRYDDAVITE